MHIAKAAVIEQELFNKDRSVFKDFEEDVPEFLRLCFNQDMKYAKVERLFKKDMTQYDRVKEFLFEHYERILGVFDFYSGISDHPRISMNDITSFAHHTMILDNKYINLSALDLLLVATNVSINKYKVSAERDICRYELLEFFIRTANFRYVE